jgi:DNA-binding transcriptional LysR family regulator
MNDWAEFRHFKYLLAIVEYMGFRAAAEHLHTAEPNLSVQAKQFQENFGIRLFKKASNGRIQLTATGVAFKAIARDLLKARDEAIAALVAIERGEIDSLRFGCASGIHRDLFRTAQKLHKEIVPDCSIRPVLGGTCQLVEEFLAGTIDAAIVTSPIDDERLHVEEIRRDRLLVCVRKDHSLASKGILHAEDLRGMPIVLCHPQINLRAHVQTLSYFGEAGAQVNEFAQASHPTELQALVKDGYGIALVREGMELDPDLTAKPVAGVDWTMDSSLAYNKQRHPKSIPVLARHLKLRLGAQPIDRTPPTEISARQLPKTGQKRGPKTEGESSEQMSLLG